MAQDISGFGGSITLVASNTFPVGIIITQFADDADAFDLPALRIGESAMGLNGDLVKWSKAIALTLTINVIPNSPDDQNLAILANANRVAQGKLSARDIITATIAYPDGTIKTFTQGLITDSEFGLSVTSAGRMKSKPYSFTFQNFVG